MSVCTSLCVSVSPKVALPFLRFIKELREKPNKVTKDYEGNVTAIWDNRVDFHEHSSDSDYNAIIDFLTNLDYDEYYYEVYEHYAPIMRGGYFPNFAIATMSEAYGNSVDLNSVMSENRKSRKFLNRRGRR